MATLTRAQILNAPRQTVDFDVPEWGGTVKIAALSGATRFRIFDIMYEDERLALEWKDMGAEARDGKEPPRRHDIELLTMMLCVVDDEGKALFTLDDYDAFTDLSYDTQIEMWKAFEATIVKPDQSALKKTSARTRKGGSSSASQKR